MTAVSLAIQMALLMFIGFFARKKNIVDEHFTASLAGFIFNFVFPCIIINAMQVKFDPQDMYNSGILIGISTFTIFLMLGIGIIVNKMTGKDDDLSRLLLVTFMFTNFTYMAFPVMESLYGEKGLFYISIYTIPVRILFYVLTPFVFTIGINKAIKPTRREIGRDALKAFLSPPVISVPIGLVIYIFGIQLPGPISSVIKYLAGVATPMGMVLCGATLAAISLTHFWKEFRVWLITALRLIVAPAIMLGLYFVFRQFFSLDPLVAKVTILYCALPAAATTTVIAIQMKSDAERSAQSIFLTTIISVITLPVWAYLLDLVII